MQARENHSLSPDLHRKTPRAASPDFERLHGRLYCAESDGEVVVLATGDEFEELARNDLLEETRATPAVAGGRMDIRTFSHLQCVGPAPASE